MAEIKVMDAAHGYVEMLNRLGVDYVFSSPGSEFIPIWEHLARYNSENKKPYYVNVRHESAALSMAKGYYMATGRGQALLTHVITGLLHGAMELKAAYTDQIPLLLIVGQNRTHDREVYGGTPGPHYLSFTEVGGQQRLVQPYVKWGDSPETNANILDTIQRAYQIASSDVKGPVLLSVSREILFEKINTMKLPTEYVEPTSISADPKAIQNLKEMLMKAENPLIYTRYLGRNRGAVSSLVELAELLGVPVFEHPGYMNFPTNHPLHMGTNMSQYLEEADLILIIDSSSWPPWYPPGSIRGKTNAKIVFMDLDPIQEKYPTYGYPADMLMKADSSIAVPQLIDQIKSEKPDEAKTIARSELWGKEHQRIRNDLKEKALAVKDEYPINPRWLNYCINEAIDENTIIVNETITHGTQIHQYIEKNRVVPGTRYEATGPIAHTGLGQGMGVALGVKLAEPDKTVIALEGDGTFNYNPVLACFGASQEYNIPYMTIIYNNSCYAAMKGHARYYPNGHSVTQDQYFGVGCGPTPQYAKLVEAYDGYSATVEDPSEVKPALTNALKKVRDGKLTLLDMRLAR
ncbi:MAG: thiamine pyrophosphate-binding protein [Candidatus Bathyarchaeota archaeon]|nr:thiamine pyrophosphate-binding protein [Candidatus Bathyarchaeota archaeon]